MGQTEELMTGRKGYGSASCPSRDGKLTNDGLGTAIRSLGEHAIEVDRGDHDAGFAWWHLCVHLGAANDECFTARGE
jgi:hypothetical protein